MSESPSTGETVSAASSALSFSPVVLSAPGRAVDLPSQHWREPSNSLTRIRSMSAMKRGERGRRRGPSIPSRRARLLAATTGRCYGRRLSTGPLRR
jgi:hypothetical protein